jgi:hypothetical protein
MGFAKALPMFFETHASEPEARRALRNGPPYVPAGTPRHAMRRFRTGCSGRGDRDPVEQGSRPQQRMQDHGAFACGDGGAFEADLFPELQTPGRFNPAPGQDHCGGLAGAREGEPRREISGGRGRPRACMSGSSTRRWRRKSRSPACRSTTKAARGAGPQAAPGDAAVDQRAAVGRPRRGAARRQPAQGRAALARRARDDAACGPADDPHRAGQAPARGHRTDGDADHGRHLVLRRT